MASVDREQQERRKSKHKHKKNHNRHLPRSSSSDKENTNTMVNTRGNNNKRKVNYGDSDDEESVVDWRTGRKKVKDSNKRRKTASKQAQKPKAKPSGGKQSTRKKAPPKQDSDTSGSETEGHDSDAEARKKEIAKLKAQLAEAQSAAAAKGGRPPAKARGGGKKLTPEEIRTNTFVRKGLREYGWGHVIYVSTEEKLKALATVVAVDHQPTELNILDKAEHKKAVVEWVQTHLSTVANQWNNIRNYTQSQLREELEPQVARGDADVPTIEELTKCAYRDPDFLKTDRGKLVFDYYHDTILMKTALKENWGEKFRHHNTISKAMKPASKTHKKGRPCVSPDVEAYTVTLLENHYPKWEKQAKEKQALGKKFKFDPKADYAKTEFTSSLNGGSKFGGWNKAGRERFRMHRQKVKEGRALATTAAFEEATLQRLR